MSCKSLNCDNVWCLNASCKGVSPSLSGMSKLAPSRTRSYKMTLNDEIQHKLLLLLISSLLYTFSPLHLLNFHFFSLRASTMHNNLLFSNFIHSTSIHCNFTIPDTAPIYSVEPLPASVTLFAEPLHSLLHPYRHYLLK